MTGTTGELVLAVIAAIGIVQAAITVIIVAMLVVVERIANIVASRSTCC